MHDFGQLCSHSEKRLEENRRRTTAIDLVRVQVRPAVPIRIANCERIRD